jgi:hypothetical protein
MPEDRSECCYGHSGFRGARRERVPELVDHKGKPFASVKELHLPAFECSRQE